DLLAQRGELRARARPLAPRLRPRLPLRRRRAGWGFGGGRGCKGEGGRRSARGEEDLRARSVESTGLRRLRPYHHRRGGTHAGVHRRPGGGVVRRGVITRETTETQIALTLIIEGRGRYQVSTGIRFLDHMLELFTRHGAFDLTLNAT